MGYRLRLLELSRRVSRNSKPLYDALTTGVPLSAAVENVENLNYLQCYWAHAAIYSNGRDFTFAKHCIFSVATMSKNTQGLHQARSDAGSVLTPPRR